MFYQLNCKIPSKKSQKKKVLRITRPPLLCACKGFTVEKSEPQNHKFKILASRSNHSLPGYVVKRS